MRVDFVIILFSSVNADGLYTGGTIFFANWILLNLDKIIRNCPRLINFDSFVLHAKIYIYIYIYIYQVFCCLIDPCISWFEREKNLCFVDIFMNLAVYYTFKWMHVHNGSSIVTWLRFKNPNFQITSPYEKISWVIQSLVKNLVSDKNVTLKTFLNSYHAFWNAHTTKSI